MVTLKQQVEIGLCPAGIRDIRRGFLGVKVSITSIFLSMLVLPSLPFPIVFIISLGNVLFK
jgi:hypothetical protein